MREVEAKFRVHPPFQVPDLTGDTTGVATTEGPTARELLAVYYDTSDLRLAREGITLRYRSGEGDKDGWHLKLPIHAAGVPDASTGTREELHDSGPADVVPEPLRELVAVYLRSATLGPVATLQTMRSAYELKDAEGNILAELTDDLVSVLNQGHVAARFREIEVEDMGGGPDVLGAVGTTLRSAGAVGGEFVPKVVRALGPQATGDPDPPKPASVSLNQPARLALQAILRRYVRAFMSQDPAVRRDQPDSVHQMRVAARRLRSALKTFGPLVEERWAKSLRAELKWVADSLGVARDSEVLLARLRDAIDALDPADVLGNARQRLESAIGRNLESGQKQALDVLGTDRYLSLVDRLVNAAWDPMTTQLAQEAAADALPVCVGSAWERLARAAAKLRRPSATDDDWHQARIAAKQVRYAAESVAPFYGRDAKGLAKRAEEVQELLGEHQDAVVAAGVLKELATASRAGSASFTFGLLYAGQLHAIDKTRAAFPATWSDAAKAKHRKWLRS